MFCKLLALYTSFNPAGYNLNRDDLNGRKLARLTKSGWDLVHSQ